MTNPGKNFIGEMYSSIESLLDAIPILKGLGKGLRAFMDGFSKVFTYTIGVIAVTTAPIGLLLSPISQLMTSPTRKGEEFADSFATMYGYGTPLISALNKMSTSNLSNSETPLIKTMTDLAVCYRYFCNLCAGDHGTNLDRLNSNISYLTREIAASGYPNEVKREMLLQVRQLEEARDLMLSGKIGEQDKLAISSFIMTFFNELFKGRTDYIAKLFGPNLVQ